MQRKPSLKKAELGGKNYSRRVKREHPPHPPSLRLKWFLPYLRNGLIKPDVANCDDCWRDQLLSETSKLKLDA